MCSLHGIIKEYDSICAEVGLVTELVLEEAGGGVGPEVHGLIPSNAIIVNVDFTEHLHHFELVFVSVECGCVGVHGWVRG